MQNENSLNTKIVKMCSMYENKENIKPSDEEYYIKFWNKQKRLENYCGKQGLHTIIDSYIKNKYKLDLHMDADWKLMDKYRKKYYRKFDVEYQ